MGRLHRVRKTSDRARVREIHSYDGNARYTGWSPGREIIHDHDVAAGVANQPYNMGAYIASPARNKYSHARDPPGTLMTLI